MGNDLSLTTSVESVEILIAETLLMQNCEDSIQKMKKYIEKYNLE